MRGTFCGICDNRPARSGILAKGTDTMTTSAPVMASTAATARTPSVRMPGSIVSGPRELAMVTSWPAAPSFVASRAPMFPAPMMPIFMVISLGAIRIRQRGTPHGPFAR